MCLEYLCSEGNGEESIHRVIQCNNYCTAALDNMTSIPKNNSLNQGIRNSKRSNLKLDTQISITSEANKQVS